MALSRRERIFEAIENRRTTTEIGNLPIKLTTDNTLKGISKLKRITMKCLAFTTSHLPPDQRIERLENWSDFLLSEEGFQVLSDEFGNVAKIEEEVRAIEDKLYQNSIEIDENMFRALCTGDLIPGEMDLISEPETAPLCTSTPQHAQQTPTSTKDLTKIIAKRSSTPLSSMIPEIPTSSKNLLKMTAKRSSTPLSCMLPEIPAYIKILLQQYSDDMVPIGPNGTVVSRKALITINWSQSAANITRKLLMELFDRETLASHTLSGKPSPAFLGCNKPTKEPLDEQKIRDLTHVLTSSLNMTEKEVRQAITTKCADENKMWRQRMQKILAIKSKENRIKN